MNNRDRFYLRPAARVDADAIHQLRAAIFAQEFPEFTFDDVAEHDELVRILTNPQSTSIWLADLNNTIAGYIRTDSLGVGHNRMLAVTWFGVRADVRRRHYGTKLLNAAIGDMPTYAYAPRAIASNTGFYESNEFTRIKNDDDALAVVTELTPSVPQSDGYSAFIR
ncbi:GNAT family N-acetyltransferase [Arcanobacterium phocae]|uniref:GNAT family N-acetyltransferase n=1 Tax=Arcanobacterium phocae TaxID=131112 RepID=UPI001C0EE6C9|nr:GNAT family N-acetyltransferase [Arcanobacterium phocae]